MDWAFYIKHEIVTKCSCRVVIYNIMLPGITVGKG